MNGNGTKTLRKRAYWTHQHEIERLSQLKADVDSVMGRMLTQYLNAQAGVPEAQQADLAQRCDDVQAAWSWMAEDLSRWITDCCKDDGGQPGS